MLTISQLNLSLPAPFSVSLSGVFMILISLQLLFKSRAAVQLENLLLRKQIEILMRRQKRPRVTNRDRFWLVMLSRLYDHWQEAFLIFSPETLIRWHKQGFKLYWRWKSGKSPGRPPIDKELQDLISEMVRENSGWGAPRIHGELLKLGFDI